MQCGVWRSFGGSGIKILASCKVRFNSYLHSSSNRSDGTHYYFQDLRIAYTRRTEVAKFADMRRDVEFDLRGLDDFRKRSVVRFDCYEAVSDDCSTFLYD